MADPNQGPPPGAPGASGPPPGTNANTDPDPNPGHTFPVRDIDLSDPMFVSDGVMQQHQATVDVEFLNRLSGHFNHQPNSVTTLGYNVNFVGGLPQGYVLKSRERFGSRTRVDQRVTVDHSIHGHPLSNSFRSVIQFARHIYHIMRNDLPNCDCNLC
ncbi:hypothetical protein KCU73_g5835, partial [Aureobasidium melanogenum]